MDAPDVTYKFLYPKDVSGPTFELESVFNSLTLTAASATFSYLGVAKDRVFIVTAVTISGIPTGTESCIRLNAAGITPGGVVFNFLEENFVAVAAQRQSANWQGAVYIGGSGAQNEIVRISASFSAGVLTKDLRSNIHGIVIPRGNIAPY